jgi:hypothetical protein
MAKKILIVLCRLNLAQMNALNVLGPSEVITLHLLALYTFQSFLKPMEKMEPSLTVWLDGRQHCWRFLSRMEIHDGCWANNAF